VATVEEYRRFTLAELNAGATAGWTFAGGSWYRFGNGWWAWFRRDDG